MEISLNSMMLALKAIQRDLDRHQALLRDDDLTDDDADYYSQYVLDLTRTLGEFSDLYERSRTDEPLAPSLEQLLRDAEMPTRPQPRTVLTAASSNKLR